MSASQLVITLLGSAGGVARAVLAVLDHASGTPDDPLHDKLSGSKLYLLDREARPKSYYARLLSRYPGKFGVLTLDLENRDQLLHHLRSSGTTLVIDCSWADTLGTMACCHETGAAYVNTALECVEADDDASVARYSLLRRYDLFEQRRGSFPGLKAIACSGMNPGLVQWMAMELLRREGGRVPDGCYIVERDTTFLADPEAVEPETVYTSWSPECFLEEAVENYPMFVSRGRPFLIAQEVYEEEFKVRLGGISFSGCLMPHEEALALGRRFDMEVGFIYRINDYMTEQIRGRLEETDGLWDWKLVVLDPRDSDLTGEDLVGVLFVYPDRERYMYHVLDSMDCYARYGVNATYFQVACGVYAAAAVLIASFEQPSLLPPGVYLVDELPPGALRLYGERAMRYLGSVTVGENAGSDGLLMDRITRPL